MAMGRRKRRGRGWLWIEAERLAENPAYKGYRLKGRTPAQALREALGRDELPNLDFTADKKEADNDQTRAA